LSHSCQELKDFFSNVEAKAKEASNEQNQNFLAGIERIVTATKAPVLPPANAAPTPAPAPNHRALGFDPEVYLRRFTAIDDMEMRGLMSVQAASAARDAVKAQMNDEISRM